MTHSVVVGLGWGDEGKGAVVNQLAREACTRHERVTVCKFNGGPQAGHRVVDLDGRSHIFSQLGAGSFMPGTQTHLASTMLVNPFNLMREAKAFDDLVGGHVLHRLTIDPECPIVTPYHIHANRKAERARAERHGSCGMGVGACREDLNDDLVLRMGQLVYLSESELIGRLREFQHRHDAFDELPYTPGFYARSYKELIRRLNLQSGIGFELDEETVIFEGAQGMLLDEDYGQAPYYTWSKCSTQWADDIINAAGYTGPIERIGVTRTYVTRHGLGPLANETKQLQAVIAKDEHNTYNTWQGEFRTAFMDFEKLKYAYDNSGCTSIAVNCVDQWCTPSNIVDRIAEVGPVCMIGMGPNEKFRVGQSRKD